MRKRIAITLGAGVLVALLLLREAGAFDLNLSTSSSESNYHSEWNTDPGDELVTSWSTRVQFEDREPSYSPDVVEAARGGPSADIVVHVEPLDIQGCTWLPLYKWGTCSFRARAVRNGRECGSMEGTLEMSVKGVASSRSVRESMREEVRKHLSDTVSSYMRR